VAREVVPLLTDCAARFSASTTAAAAAAAAVAANRIIGIGA